MTTSPYQSSVPAMIAMLGNIMAGREPRPPEGWDSSGGPGAPATVSGGGSKGDEPGLGEPASQHRTQS